MKLIKAGSSTAPIIVGIIVAIVAIGTAVYAYLEYHALITPTTSVTTTTSSTSTIKLNYNPSNKTVFLTIAVLTTGPSFNFNGTSNGQLIIYVPADWNVYVNFVNYQAIPHNLIILENTTPTPSSADVAQFGKILFALGATSSNYLTAGISSGASVGGLYGPIPPGIYMIVCGIEGHTESGMWAVLVSSSNVTTPYAVIA